MSAASGTKTAVQRYLIPSAIMVGVIVGSLVLFYMALFGAGLSLPWEVGETGDGRVGRYSIGHCHEPWGRP